MQESEERARRRFLELDAIYRTAPLGLCVLDTELRYRRINEYLAALNGFSVEEHLGKTVREIVPDLTTQAEQALRNVLETGRPLRIELRGETKAKPGEQGIWDEQWYPLRDPDGKITGIGVVADDVTERRRAEEELRKSEERYRKLFDSIDEGFCVVDLIYDEQQRPVDYRFVEVNPAFLRQTGLVDAVGKTARTMVPTHEEGWFEIFGKVARTGEPIHFERRELGRYYEVYAFRVGKDRVAALFGDVSERKRWEDVLRESEERFRTLGDNIAQLAWMTDADGSIFWYNRRWYDYTGTTLEEMKGWGWEKVHHQEHLAGVLDKWTRHLKAGEPWEDTFPLRGKDGVYRWFLSRAFPIRDEQGRIVRWFGTNTDITELRETQEALAERESVLRAVTTEAHVGLVMVGEDRRYLFANQTYAEILGLADANIIGKRVAEVLPAVYEDQIKSRLDRAFAGERLSYELRVPSHPRTHGEHTYEVVYEPRHNASGRYVVVVIVDVTERKKAQELLERTVAERTKELKDTNDQLEAFVYSIAHDLRAPLRAMQGFSELLLEDKESFPAQNQQFVDRIHRSAEYMDRMLLDLLAFGRTARMEVSLGRVETEGAWESALYQCAQQIEQTGAVIDVVRPLLNVRAHEPTLTQVLANLITNGIKFVAPGVTPHLRFWTEDQGATVRLWLEDNGIGIERQYYERIFRVFERLEGTKFAGTGIGLSIVRKGVERMNGKVGLESRVGEGTKFWIELAQG